MADDQGKGWHSDNEEEHQRHVEAGREAAKTAEERNPGIHIWYYCDIYYLSERR